MTKIVQINLTEKQLLLLNRGLQLANEALALALYTEDDLDKVASDVKACADKLISKINSNDWLELIELLTRYHRIKNG